MYHCKKILFLFCFIAASLFSVAQSDSLKNDTNTSNLPTRRIKRIRKPIIKRDSASRKDSTARIVARPSLKDSLQVKDTANNALLDSTLIKDSLLLAKRRADSIRLDEIRRTVEKSMTKDTSNYAGIFGGPYIPINLSPVTMLEKERRPEGKEELFYVLLGLVALVSFTRAIFPKYFSNMFSLFFQTSYRQKQAIEQLANNAISSLLLNIAFIVCLAVYITILFEGKGVANYNFWVLLVYSFIIVAIIYISKFLFLNFMGWIFNAKDSMESYMFLVFLSNKIMAIILIPFVFVLAFTGGDIAPVALIISYVLLGGVLLYRFVVVVGTLGSELKISGFHFFLYFCALEILPLLLIYKAVLKLTPTSI